MLLHIFFFFFLFFITETFDFCHFSVLESNIWVKKPLLTAQSPPSFNNMELKVTLCVCGFTIDTLNQPFVLSDVPSRHCWTNSLVVRELLLFPVAATVGRCGGAAVRGWFLTFCRFCTTCVFVKKTEKSTIFIYFHIHRVSLESNVRLYLQLRGPSAFSCVA